MKTFYGGKIEIHAGDCMDTLRQLEPDSIDAVVTDPPYHLTSIVKRFGAGNAAPAQFGKDGAFARASRGFMGKQWDGGDIAFTPELWSEVLRVLKPGGHMVAFSGTRTYHRMAVAIEDAGFEIRDQLAWVYGSGFPKSHNQGNGLGTALKPAWEPICLARKPLSEGTVAANVLRWGTGAINIDACRVEGGERPLIESDRRLEHNTYGPGLGGSKAVGLTALGRWPANLCHDGSPEVLAGFPDGGGQGKASGPTLNGTSESVARGRFNGVESTPFYNDSGSAARFFYTAKADADDRLRSKHPTVKPVDLMQWLVRMVCPKGGLVLDPFAGTGTTGAAAFIEGCRAIVIEREAEYLADIERRMELLLAGPDERARKLAIPEPFESLPLFGGK